MYNKMKLVLVVYMLLSVSGCASLTHKHKSQANWMRENEIRMRKECSKMGGRIIETEDGGWKLSDCYVITIPAKE